MKDSRPGAARAFSLVEVAISTIVIGVMYAAVLNTVAAAKLTQAATADRIRGHELAQQLLTEILLLPYVDPQDNSEFGPASAEAAASRGQFDDVDDYHRYSESPPKHSDGSDMADLAGWSRTVTVIRANTNDLTAAATIETGAKRITVQVLRGTKVVAEAAALRTNVD